MCSMNSILDSTDIKTDLCPAEIDQNLSVLWFFKKLDHLCVDSWQILIFYGQTVFFLVDTVLFYHN